MTTILFNKPFDVVTRFSAPDNAKVDQLTLAHFISDTSVWPIGRLDRDSEGLLVLSTDPRIRGGLLDPASHHKRSYWVQVEHVPTEEALRELASGITLDGRLTRPAEAHLLESPQGLWERTPPIRHRLTVPTAWIELFITEGRNRQVRRMTAAVGHPCLRLIRASIGSLRLAELGLGPGEWRQTNSEEFGLLKSMT